MPRVQFVETITAPSGVNGALIPLSGIGATPYVVNLDGTEGGQANAFASRIGSTPASSLVTDTSGTVSYWLDAGDYNVHMADQQSPKRVADFIRGFTAPVIDTNQLIVGAQNLIQFTGDTKFSMQATDHGLKPDGSFEWLLVVSDTDGGGRKVDSTIYSTLWALLGHPTVTSGQFRLPNVSGRALVACGAASGLTVRNLNDSFGVESQSLILAQIPSHDHGGATVGGSIPSAGTFNTTDNGFDHQHPGPAGGSYYYDALNQGMNVVIVGGSGPFPPGTPTGNFGVPTNNNSPWRIFGVTPNANVNHHHQYTIPGLTVPALGINPAGSGASPLHPNIQPSAAMNLFVKT